VSLLNSLKKVGFSLFNDCIDFLYINCVRKWNVLDAERNLLWIPGAIFQKNKKNVKGFKQFAENLTFVIFDVGQIMIYILFFFYF